MKTSSRICGRYRPKRARDAALLDFGEWELTSRELVFSALIVGCMAVMGFFVSGFIEKSVLDAQLKYRQAAQIQDPVEFAHAADTDMGDAFVHGRLEAVGPVSCEKLDGEYLCIKMQWQEYRRHTRTYTVSDGKGHTRVRTRTYWSWDTVSFDRKNARRVLFCGREFPYSAFRYDFMKSSRHIVDTGSNRRIVFDVVPRSAAGSVFARLAGGTVSGSPQFMDGWSIDRHYKDATESHAVALFWAIWSLLTAGAVFAFWYADNRWLE